ncbi:hypothetical protein H6P81_015998 [Aristolochia fimbriata]|uniref:Uncharacterized protein n=1 Tax=Aristolochia fimbriata TaxID=158543 RepID=A0AAV7E7J0_ARIFI|nr:hypothetical protein H6P81_015998 [Aristolochia fimbriata]
MDTLARGLRNVAKLIEEGDLDGLVWKRYSHLDSEIGAMIEIEKLILSTYRKKVSNWANLLFMKGSRDDIPIGSMNKCVQ